MRFFGRPGGPARTVLAAVAVGALGLLTFVIFNLNTRLDNQQRANLTSLSGSRDLVEVNDHLTVQLQQLTEITETTRTAVDATDALGPILDRLAEAIKPAADMLSSSASNAVLTNEQLTSISSILGEVQNTVVPLVSSAQSFGDQGQQLLATIQALIGDLQTSVESARRINEVLPLPG